MLSAGAHGLSDGACGLRGASLLIVTCVPAHYPTSSCDTNDPCPSAGENRIKKWHIDLDDAEGVPVTKVKSFRAHNDWVCGANAPRNKLLSGLLNALSLCAAMALQGESASSGPALLSASRDGSVRVWDSAVRPPLSAQPASCVAHWRRCSTAGVHTPRHSHRAFVFRELRGRPFAGQAHAHCIFRCDAPTLSTRCACICA